MNLDQIRNLPDGSPVPDDLKVQVRESPKVINGKHSKVSLADSSGRMSAFVFNKTDLVAGAWYDISVGQDNKGRERVRKETYSGTTQEGKPFANPELKIDGGAVFGPMDPPASAPSSSPSPGGGSRPPASQLQTADVLAWMKATAPEVQGIVKKLVPGQVASDTEAGARVAQTVTECGQRLLTTLLIQVLDGKLGMGEPSAAMTRETPDTGMQDEDDIVF